MPGILVVPFLPIYGLYQEQILPGSSSWRTALKVASLAARCPEISFIVAAKITLFVLFSLYFYFRFLSIVLSHLNHVEKYYCVLNKQ